ncbi:hypothetical protein GW915_05440 [bacterium]|nr:hypothetical protein [bacterium]
MQNKPLFTGFVFTAYLLGFTSNTFGQADHRRVSTQIGIKNDDSSRADLQQTILAKMKNEANLAFLSASISDQMNEAATGFLNPKINNKQFFTELLLATPLSAAFIFDRNISKPDSIIESIKSSSKLITVTTKSPALILTFEINKEGQPFLSRVEGPSRESISLVAPNMTDENLELLADEVFKGFEASLNDEQKRELAQDGLDALSDEKGSLEAEKKDLPWWAWIRKKRKKKEITAIQSEISKKTNELELLDTRKGVIQTEQAAKIIKAVKSKASTHEAVSIAQLRKRELALVGNKASRQRASLETIQQDAQKLRNDINQRPADRSKAIAEFDLAKQEMSAEHRAIQSLEQSLASEIGRVRSAKLAQQEMLRTLDAQLIDLKKSAERPAAELRHAESELKRIEDAKNAELDKQRKAVNSIYPIDTKISAADWNELEEVEWSTQFPSLYEEAKTTLEIDQSGLYSGKSLLSYLRENNPRETYRVDEKVTAEKQKEKDKISKQTASRNAAMDKESRLVETKFSNDQQAGVALVAEAKGKHQSILSQISNKEKELKTARESLSKMVAAIDTKDLEIQQRSNALDRRREEVKAREYRSEQSWNDWISNIHNSVNTLKSLSLRTAESTQGLLNQGDFDFLDTNNRDIAGIETSNPSSVPRIVLPRGGYLRTPNPNDANTRSYLNSLAERAKEASDLAGKVKAKVDSGVIAPIAADERMLDGVQSDIEAHYRRALKDSFSDEELKAMKDKQAQRILQELK